MFGRTLFSLSLFCPLSPFLFVFDCLVRSVAPSWYPNRVFRREPVR